ncbi:MAG: hypothetical protein QGG71_04985 [Pirellulaceae bacterium]|nr:hypothetical protein [Pirellulaceae bacterium]
MPQYRHTTGDQWSRLPANRLAAYRVAKCRLDPHQIFWLRMQFRQNGQRDERRRRVLRDEMLTSPEAEGDEAQVTGGRETETKVPPRGYSAAVSIESQPPISCLIATRPWTLTVAVLAGLTVIAGLEAAYSNIFHGSHLRPEVTAALDVVAPGSLAAWFSSVLLSMAAVNAVLVYWLRSHRLDDYRARYRVWLWAAFGLTIAAIDASTSLHSVVGQLIADRFEMPWLQSPMVNGVVVLSLVFGSLAARLGFEIWSSRLARSWSLLAAISYFTAILIQLDVLVVDSVLLTAMAESTVILVANLAVTLVVASYCRYVYLESQGELKPRRQRRRKLAVDVQGTDDKGRPDKKLATRSARGSLVKPAEDDAPKGTLRTNTINSKSIRCDSAHQSLGDAQAAKKASGNLNPAESAGHADMLDFDPETGERLSKSERRRLRKQMRRQKKTGSG